MVCGGYPWRWFDFRGFQYNFSFSYFLCFCGLCVVSVAVRVLFGLCQDFFGLRGGGRSLGIVGVAMVWVCFVFVLWSLLVRCVFGAFLTCRCMCAGDICKVPLPNVIDFKSRGFRCADAVALLLFVQERTVTCRFVHNFEEIHVLSSQPPRRAHIHSLILSEYQYFNCAVPGFWCTLDVFRQ